MKTSGKINWSEIEHRYIVGTESYSIIAKAYNLKVSQIAKVAGREKWVEKRNDFRQSVLQKARKESECDAVEHLKNLQIVAGGAVKTMSEYFSKDGMVYQPNEFKQLTGALKDLTAVLRDIYTITEGNDDSDNTINVIVPAGFEDYGN